MNKSEAVCQDISPGTRTPDLSASVPELLSDNNFTAKSCDS